MPASTRDGPSATRVPSNDERRGTNLEPVGGGACCALRGLHTPRSQLRRARSHEWPPGASRGGRTRHAAGRRKRAGSREVGTGFRGPAFLAGRMETSEPFVVDCSVTLGTVHRKESQNGEKAPNAFGARKSATSVRLLSRARAHTRTPARVGPRIADPKSAARVSRLRRSERYAPSRTRDAKRDWRIDRGERRARSIRDARTTTQSWRPWICSSAR